jgi:hypothetical protein
LRCQIWCRGSCCARSSNAWIGTPISGRTLGGHCFRFLGCPRRGFVRKSKKQSARDASLLTSMSAAAALRLVRVGGSRRPRALLRRHWLRAARHGPAVGHAVLPGSSRTSPRLRLRKRFAHFRDADLRAHGPHFLSGIGPAPERPRGRACPARTAAGRRKRRVRTGGLHRAFSVAEEPPRFKDAPARARYSECIAGRAALPMHFQEPLMIT